MTQLAEAGDDDAETYARSLYVLRMEGGLVVHHILYCTGQWDRASVERNAVEAPIYEP